MADAIIYCDRCARLIRPTELEQALRTGAATICPSCAKALSPDERAALSAAGGGAPPPSTARVKPRRPRARTSAIPTAKQAPTKRAPLGIAIFGVVAGVPLGIALVLLLVRAPKHSPAPRPLRPARPTAPAVTVEPEAARPPGGKPAAQESPAQRRLREIRSMIDPSIRDFEEIRTALKAFPSEHAGAPEVPDAKRLLAELDEKYAALADSALGKAIDTAGQMASRGEHRRAERAIREAGERFSGGSWLKDKGQRAIEEAVTSLRKRPAEVGPQSLELARRALGDGDFGAARAALGARSGWLAEDRRRAEALLGEIKKTEEAEGEERRRAEDWRSFLAELVEAGRNGVAAAKKLVEGRRERLAAIDKADELVRIERRLRGAEMVESLALEGLRARSGVVRLKLRERSVAGRVLAVDGRTIRLRPVIGDPVEVALDDVTPAQIVEEAGLLRGESGRSMMAAGYYLARGEFGAARAAIAEATSEKALALDEDIDEIEKALPPLEPKEPTEVASSDQAPRVTRRAGIAVEAAPKSVIYEPFDYAAGSDIRGKGGSSDYGLDGPWKASKQKGPVHGGSLSWGTVPTIGNCAGADHNVIAHRSLSREALRDTGLLEDGATLWFSLLMSVKDANLSNVDFNVALATESFDPASYQVREHLKNLGFGIGMCFARGDVLAAYWGDGTRHAAKRTARKLNATNDSTALIAGKMTWGRDGAEDSVELYAPGRDLDPGPVISRISADLDQAELDLLAYEIKTNESRLDEIRFGATYADVTSDTIAKLLHGLSVEDAVGRPERDGYSLSLGVLKRLAEQHDGTKVSAKKLAALGDAIAVSSRFDASLRKALRIADGYLFAGRTGFASNRLTVTAARKSVRRALAREKPEVVRICIGLADIARNVPANNYVDALGGLVDEVAGAGAVPVLHTLPARTVEIPKDKKKRDGADRATKAAWALSRVVCSYNDAIRALAIAKKVPLVDAWLIVNRDAETQQTFFSARGGLKREGSEAINASFLRLYRILERGVTGRETAVPARDRP